MRAASVALTAVLVGFVWHLPGGFPVDRAAAATEVRVGGYTFPPFVSETVRKGGVTPAILDALNAAQDRFHFTFVPTAARRRYRDFQRGRFDVILFEMPSWSWRQRGIAFETVPPILKAGEVYVARAGRVQDGTYFDSVSGKTIGAFIGYHYRFAGGEDDPRILRRKYDIRLTNSHAKNIRKVLKGHVDVAIVTRSYLDIYLGRHPELRDELAISQRMAQRYRLGGLVRPDAPLSAATLTRLLKDLDRSGDLRRILTAYGLADQLVFRGDTG